MQHYPQSADLTHPPEPRLTVDALTSEHAADDFEARYHAWAKGLELQVDRLCRWAKAEGAPALNCPAPL